MQVYILILCQQTGFEGAYQMNCSPNMFPCRDNAGMFQYFPSGLLIM